jgi:hypothetical protein
MLPHGFGDDPAAGLCPDAGLTALRGRAVDECRGNRA